MRDYGRVYTTFWESQRMRSLSEDGRMLALYLLSCPHSTIAGVFRLPDGYVCDDLQWSSERVAKGFSELLANGFANRCGTTKWVWICRHLEWNQLDNPNQRKAAAKVAMSTPDDCVWKPAFMRACGEVLALEPWSPPNPSGTVSKPFANQEQEQEQEQKQKQDQKQEEFRLGADAPPAARRAKPSKSNRAEQEKPKTAEVWKAYDSAYTERYGEAPVRNVKVNALLSQFLSRLPSDEAPAVAAFYVRSNNQFYVAKGHSVAMLLADAEKLRTEWVTGRQTTATQARLVDQTQTNANAFAGLISEAQAKQSRHHGFADRNYEGPPDGSIPE